MKVKMITDVKKNKKNNNYLVLMKKLPKNVADNLVSQKLASKDNKSGNYQLTTKGKMKALKAIFYKKKAQDKKEEIKDEQVLDDFLKAKSYSFIRDTAEACGALGAMCFALTIIYLVPTISTILVILASIIGVFVGFGIGDLIGCLLSKKPLNFYAFSKKCPY